MGFKKAKTRHRWKRNKLLSMSQTLITILQTRKPGKTTANKETVDWKKAKSRAERKREKNQQERVPWRVLGRENKYKWKRNKLLFLHRLKTVSQPRRKQSVTQRKNTKRSILL